MIYVSFSIKKHPMFTAALITAAKMWEHPKYPSVEARIKKMCICTMEYYIAVRKKEILPFATA